MALTGTQAYAISRQFTKDTAIGMGAVKGAPCKIKSIERINDQNKVTFEWEDNTGSVKTGSMYVKDGEGQGEDDEYEIVVAREDLPQDLLPTDRKMYFVMNDGYAWLWNGTEWKPQEQASQTTYTVTGETLIINN